MTETAKKAPAKPKAEKAAKPAAEKKAAAPKAAAAKSAPKEKKPAKQAGDKGTVTVTQLVGSIARQSNQLATLKGLGLGKRHRTRTLEDTPSVRGMIYKVRHLVKVEG